MAWQVRRVFVGVTAIDIQVDHVLGATRLRVTRGPGRLVVDVCRDV
jgi:hypothetical protein